MTSDERDAARQRARTQREALLLRRARAGNPGLDPDIERLTRDVLALTAPPPPPASFVALADTDLASASGYPAAMAKIQAAVAAREVDPHEAERATQALLDLAVAQREVQMMRELALEALAKLDATPR